MKICPKCNSEHQKLGTFCSRSCANSRVFSAEAIQKKSIANKRYLENNEHPSKGKPGWKHSEEMKERKKIKTLEYFDKVGRRTPEQKAAKNRSGVSRYRARKNNATCPTANTKLMKLIFEKCPVGYDVDHIISITKGGKHHEDNLQYLPRIENRKKGNRDVYDESLAIKWQDVLLEYIGE